MKKIRRQTNRNQQTVAVAVAALIPTLYSAVEARKFDHAHKVLGTKLAFLHKVSVKQTTTAPLLGSLAIWLTFEPKLHKVVEELVYQYDRQQGLRLPLHQWAYVELARGLLYLCKGQTDKAIKHLQFALSASETETTQPEHKTHIELSANCGLSEAFLGKYEYARAREHLQRAKRVAALWSPISLAAMQLKEAWLLFQLVWSEPPK